jgi:pyrroloquinoline quinone biosynthesis protein B
VLRAVVLGAAAGGGFPQWNSNAEACRRARRGDLAARPRTQASIAVSRDGASWFVINASPDLRAQIEANSILHPRRGLRSTPIAGVVLTGADVDAIAGLLHLRERQPFALYAAPPVHAVIAANPIFGVLAPDCVERRELALGREMSLAGPDGQPSGVLIEAFAVPGKVALYLEREVADPAAASESGDAIGLALREEGDRRRLYFIPGCASMTPGLAERLRGAEIVLFDGTLWRDDEMIRLGLGQKSGRRMGHMSVSGEDGVIAAFASLDVRRKILIHINNSNPVLLEDSPERKLAAEAGWDVAFDGMEVSA